MADTNYLARIEQTVKGGVGRDAIVLGAILVETTEREGYWERMYYVAWQNEKEAGSHRACIDSDARSMLVYGTYQMKPDEAIADMIERSGLAEAR